MMRAAFVGVFLAIAMLADGSLLAQHETAQDGRAARKVIHSPLRK
jgi:hypothetical protein